VPTVGVIDFPGGLSPVGPTMAGCSSRRRGILPRRSLGVTRLEAASPLMEWVAFLGDCPRKNSGGAVDLLRRGGRGKDAASPWKEINGFPGGLFPCFRSPLASRCHAVGM